MQKFNLTGKTLLVVDDEAFVRSIIIGMLKEFGEPKVHAGNDGKHGLDILASHSHSIDAAIIDFNMPEINGLSLLKAIRTGQYFIKRDLPVAMLTGNSDSALVAKALALDVNAFLVKPTSPGALGARLERMLDEEPVVNDVEVYEAVEVPTFTLPKLVERAPPSVLLTKTKAPATIQIDEARLGPRVRTPISELTENCVLAEDVVNAHGTCLLGRNAVLTRRFLARLRDIAEIEKIQHVWVRKPM